MGDRGLGSLKIIMNCFPSDGTNHCKVWNYNCSGIPYIVYQWKDHIFCQLLIAETSEIPFFEEFKKFFMSTSKTSKNSPLMEVQNVKH